MKFGTQNNLIKFCPMQEANLHGCPISMKLNILWILALKNNLTQYSLTHVFNKLLFGIYYVLDTLLSFT